MSYDGSLKFDTKVDHAGFVSGIAEIKSTAMAAITAIGSAFATGAIAKAIIGQISALEEYGSTINDQSQKLTVAKKAYQELNYMMGQTGGNADTLQMGIKTLSSAVVDGNKAFEKLGISLEDARAMSSEDLFNKVITQLAGMEEGTLRTSLAADLFGRSATELNPLLNLGAEGIAKMRKEAADYGLIMSDQAVAATDEYGDATELAKRAAEGLRNTMLVGMLPTLTGVAKGFADLAAKSSQAFSERGVKGVVDVITDEFPVATAAVSGLATAFVALLVIQTVQKSMAAYAAVQASLTALEVAGTAQEWAEIGALTAKQLIVGALSGTVKKATAAQWLFNAAVTANPVLLLAVGIGVLVGAVVLLEKNYEKLHPEIEETREQIDALTKSIAESKASYDDSLESIDSQARGTDALITKLQQLSDEYTGSAVEQALMQSICNDLNSSIEGLNVSFDANTGVLSKNAQAIRDVAQAQADAARASAALDYYKKLLTDTANADYEVWKAEKQYNEVVASGAKEGSRARTEAATNLYNVRKEQQALNTETANFNAYLKEEGIDLGDAMSATDDLTGSTDALAETQKRVVIGGYDLTDRLDDIGMSADDAAARFDSLTAAATNMFEKIDTKARIRVKTMIENLTSNTSAIEEWGNNITLLGDKLPEELLQPLIDQGPEKMAGVLNALAKASPAEIEQLVAAFAQGGDAAREAWLKSLGAGTDAEESPLASVAEAVKNDTSLNDAMSQAVTDGKDAMVTAASEADYTEVTTQIQTGIAAGIEPLKKYFYETGSALVMQWINGMLSRKTEIVGDAILIAQAVNSAFRATLNLSIPTTTGGGSNTTKSTGGGAGGKGAIPALAQTVSADLASSLINVAAAKQAVAANNNTSIYAPITVQGIVESDAKLAKRVTNEFQGVVLYGR